MSLVLIIFRILISPGYLFKKAETEYVFLTFRRILALWQLWEGGRNETLKLNFFYDFT